MLLLEASATWQLRAYNRRVMEDTHSRDTTSRTLSTTSGRGWSRQTPRARFSGTDLRGGRTVFFQKILLVPADQRWRIHRSRLNQPVQQRRQLTMACKDRPERQHRRLQRSPDVVGR